MDTTNNIVAVNLLDSPANSGQSASSATSNVINSEASTSVFNLFSSDPERVVVSDKPLTERSIEEEQPNTSQPKQLTKFNTTCVIEKSGDILSSPSSRRESPVQTESMLDGRVEIQKAATEIKLDPCISFNIMIAVNNKNQEELDRLLQQHSVHDNILLTTHVLIIALETAITRSDERMAISLINAGIGVKYENEKRSTSGLTTALFYQNNTIAEALLKKGASVEGSIYDTKEPLHITIEHGDLKAFKLLLEYKPVLKFKFLRAALDTMLDIQQKENNVEDGRKKKIFRRWLKC